MQSRSDAGATWELLVLSTDNLGSSAATGSLCQIPQVTRRIIEKICDEADVTPRRQDVETPRHRDAKTPLRSRLRSKERGTKAKHQRNETPRIRGRRTEAKLQRRATPRLRGRGTQPSTREDRALRGGRVPEEAVLRNQEQQQGPKQRRQGDSAT